ncbi:MAG: RidA family protein [Pseudomonadota bacterium]
MRRHVSSGSDFEARVGYSRAVRDGDMVYVSGCTGFDYASMTISDDVQMQCRQTLLNLSEALEAAGATRDDVVRVRYMAPVRAEFEACWGLLSEAFGRARPAATMIVCELMDPAVKIEIEVTARVGASVTRDAAEQVLTASAATAASRDRPEPEPQD